MNEKFLAVYVIFDDETQNKLNQLQNLLINNNLISTHTTDIPFHITLGSFPLDKQTELEKRIKEISIEQLSFDIKLSKIGHFEKHVLFISPTKNKMLNNIQILFNGNYADGYKFYPHTTLFIGDKKQFKVAKQIIKKYFKPFTAKITAIGLSEFFPTKNILTENFQL